MPRTHLRLVLLALLVALFSPACGDGGSGSKPVLNEPTGASPAVHPCAQNPVICPLGLICDPLGGCVDCLFDADCGSGERCDGRSCVPATPCDTSSECAVSVATPVCDSTKEWCVECLSDSDCTIAARCEDSTCEPFTPCINSFDCPEGLVCERDAGECVRCIADGDCSPEFACVAQECTPRCESDNECLATNRLCDKGPGVCVQCVEHVDCPEVYHCDEGTCELDVCDSRVSSCDPSQNAILMCNEVGTGLTPQQCSPRTTCGDASNGFTSCLPWICDPGAFRCDPDGVTVLRCQPDGLSEVDLTDCSRNGDVCRDGLCVTLTCTAGELFCQNGAVTQCRNDGTAGAILTQCNGFEFCNSATAACEPKTCIPGEALCEGQVLTVCNAEGSGAVSGGTDCEAMSLGCNASANACVPMVCTPGTQRCTVSSILECNPQGTAEMTQPACSFGTACVESGGLAQCLATTCTAGSMVCENDVIKTCNATGTGTLPGGTDCGLAGEACFNATCLPVVCQGTTFCQGEAVFNCLDNGTRSTLNRNCPLTQFCNETGASASCVPQVCAPATSSCVGAVAGTCNSNGSGLEPGGTDCAASGDACVNGTCLPIICNAGQRFCQSGNVFTCGPQGATSSLFDTCQANEFCDDSGGSAICRRDVCTPGNLVCRGSVVAPCNSQGSGPEPTGGTDCALTGEACVETTFPLMTATCQPIVCTANEDFCMADALHRCNSTGTGSTLIRNCPAANEFCDDSGSPAVCSPQVCVANAPACDNETLATCNSNGSGHVAHGTDCSASSQVCNESVMCALAALDEAVPSAIASASSSSRIVGNYYSVATARTLTEIEQFATVSGTSLFTWVVYEADTQTGTYNRISQSTTSSSGMDQYHSSGTINVTLQPGKFYMVGVFIQGAHTHFRQVSAGQAFTSFGKRLSGLLTSGTSAPTTLSFSTSTTIYRQRLTTTGP